MRPTSSMLLSVCLILVPLSGCVELSELLDVEVLDVESPAPTPLLVPLPRDGEAAHFDSTTVGHRLSGSEHGDHHGPSTVERYEWESWQERSVKLVEDATDAWLRPLRAVQITRTFGMPDEHHGGTFTATELYELATGLSVSTSYVVEGTTKRTSCQNGACHTTVDRETYDATHFPRERTDGRWGDLAGRELVVGDTFEFERTFGHGHDTFTLRIDYEVLREETLDGERTLVVAARTHYESKHAHHHDETHATEDDATIEPQHLMWFSERASVPVREFHSWGFRLEGKEYHSNTTTVLADYEAGGPPVAWGSGTPLEPILVSEKATLAARGYHGASGTMTTYSMSRAWQNLRADRTLLDFQSYAQRVPAPVPTSAVYVPDPEEREYAWEFSFGGWKRPGPGAVSRLSFVGTTSLSYHENRESEMGHTYGDGLPDKELDQLRLVPVTFAQSMYQQIAATKQEPAIIVTIGPSSNHIEPAKATVTFGAPDKLYEMDAINAEVYMGLLGDSLTIDLVDGGLRSLNDPFQHVFLYWNILPLWSAAGLGADASALVGPFGFDPTTAPVPLP